MKLFANLNFDEILKRERQLKKAEGIRRKAESAQRFAKGGHWV
jgi:hypothetical protein